jgi:hypothetical protein
MTSLQFAVGSKEFAVGSLQQEVWNYCQLTAAN